MIWYGDIMRKLAATIVCLALSFGIIGCHKKPQAVVPPQAQAPVALAPASASVSDLMVESSPANMPAAPTAAAASKPKRERRKPQSPKAVPASPPVQVASAADVAGEASANGATAIGALTAGGDSSSQTRQDASELIAANEKRLSELSSGMLQDKKSQIKKIRNFQRQAQEALDSGDADGAKTLAVKARLLLYDLDRSGGE